MSRESHCAGNSLVKSDSYGYTKHQWPRERPLIQVTGARFVSIGVFLADERNYHQVGNAGNYDAAISPWIEKWLSIERFAPYLEVSGNDAEGWRTGLYATWPKGTRRAELQDRLDGILRVRNRIAHNERLFDSKRAQLSPMRVNADTRDLLGQLCREAATYVRGSNEEMIEDFLSLNPAPVDVRL